MVDVLLLFFSRAHKKRQKVFVSLLAVSSVLAEFDACGTCLHRNQIRTQRILWNSGFSCARHTMIDNSLFPLLLQVWLRDDKMPALGKESAGE